MSACVRKRVLPIANVAALTFSLNFFFGSSRVFGADPQLSDFGVTISFPSGEQMTEEVGEDITGDLITWKHYSDDDVVELNIKNYNFQINGSAVLKEESAGTISEDGIQDGVQTTSCAFKADDGTILPCQEETGSGSGGCVRSRTVINGNVAFTVSDIEFNCSGQSSLTKINAFIDSFHLAAAQNPTP
jgi:hypothetical protein